MVLGVDGQHGEPLAGTSQSQRFEPVCAARPEPATLCQRLSAPRRAGGARLAASRASRTGARLGGGFRWRGVGDRAGARRRWKRPFDFPILCASCSATASWIRMPPPPRRLRRRWNALWVSTVGNKGLRCVRTERLRPRSLFHDTPLRHGAARPRPSTSESLLYAGGPPQAGRQGVMWPWSQSSTMTYKATRKVSRSSAIAMSPLGKGSRWL